MRERNDFDGGNGLAVGRGGVLPKPVIPLTTKDVIGIDLTHVIHSDDIGVLAAAKGGNGGGGSGGGGGGTAYAPYIAGASNGNAGYDITIEFNGTWSAPLHDIFVRAADYYVSLIVGDVPDVKIVGKGAPRTVDDIVISASLSNIDGVNGILGQAGPTAVRSAGSLPATATMEFDIADADAFNAMGLFDDIVVHEMGHSLGFGSIWDRLGLVDNSSHFTGALANQYAIGGSPILVETDGGAGTAGSHWDDDTYPNELMTGYIDDSNYFSAMSAASFGDLGYRLSGDFASHLIAV